jgi:hypothetical protein
VKYVNKFELLKNATRLVHRLSLRSYGLCIYQTLKNRMCLEKDNFNNVPKRTMLNASTDRKLVYSAEERILYLSCKCKTYVFHNARAYKYESKQFSCPRGYYIRTVIARALLKKYIWLWDLKSFTPRPDDLL